MAATRSRKSTATKAVVTDNAETTTSAEAVDTVTSAEQATAAKKTKATKSKPRVRKVLDPNMYVTVKNGFHGVLTYKDKATGEHYRWTEFGDEIELTVSTLQKVRSAQRKFFEENWFLIDDREVIEYLNASQYYKRALTYDEFTELFDLDPDEIRERIAGLSKSQKRGIVYMAKQRIESGALYNLNVIRALEEALDTELIYK